MRRIILIIFCFTLLNSCFPAYKIYPEHHRNFKTVKYPSPVFVINKDSFQDEYVISKHSEIFNFTDDSLSKLKIKLYPLEKNIIPCGNPIVGSMLTLGQLPSEFPDKYKYSFDLINNDVAKSEDIELEVHQHLWFWNLFSNKKNFKKQIGIALRAKYLE